LARNVASPLQSWAVSPLQNGIAKWALLPGLNVSGTTKAEGETHEEDNVCDWCSPLSMSAPTSAADLAARPLHPSAAARSRANRQWWPGLDLGRAQRDRRQFCALDVSRAGFTPLQRTLESSPSIGRFNSFKRGGQTTCPDRCSDRPAKPSVIRKFTALDGSVSV